MFYTDTEASTFVAADGAVSLPFKMGMSPKMSIMRYPASSSSSSYDSSSFGNDGSWSLSTYFLSSSMERMDINDPPLTHTNLLSSYPSSAFISDVIRLQIDDMSVCKYDAGIDDMSDKTCLTSHNIQYYHAVNITIVRTVVHTISCDEKTAAGFEPRRTFTCPGGSDKENIVIDCESKPGAYIYI